MPNLDLVFIGLIVSLIHYAVMYYISKVAFKNALKETKELLNELTKHKE